jgi:hypothetical protein
LLLAVAVGVLVSVTDAQLATADEARDMTAVVTGFYQAYETWRPPDGIPSDAVRQRLAPFISPALDTLLLAGEAAQARYLDVTKGRYPPLIEGDVFTPNFEGATSFSVKSCAAGRGPGRCAVALSYDGGSRRAEWTDTVSLVRTSGGWRVDDIVYGGNQDARGSLVHSLADAIAQADGIR